MGKGSGLGLAEVLEHGSYDLAQVHTIMPEITVREVVALLRAVTPELPVIVSFGFTTGNELESLHSVPGVSLLSKPYSNEPHVRVEGGGGLAATGPRP
jgi:CheY-like chemotaxis protein